MHKLYTYLIISCLATMVKAQNYTLVWNEDFTDGALDTKVWNIEVNGDGVSPTLPSREGEKVLRNGQLLIIRGEKVYTITGQIVE